MAVDPESFKLGMRRLAAGVCLITTQGSDGTPRGMTATAVCSVSASPPVLLCCINRRNSSYDAIHQSRVFAVSVLAVEDRALADLFARSIPAEQKFAGALWQTGVTGVPMLESALASFDCRVSQDVVIGTHGILFGEIQDITVRKGTAKPLLYAHGGYGGFASFAGASDLEGLWTPGWDYEPS